MTIKDEITKSVTDKLESLNIGFSDLKVYAHYGLTPSVFFKIDDPVNIVRARRAINELNSNWYRQISV